MKELIKNIEGWAAERNLLSADNAENQYMKYLEEVGETAKAILEKNKPGVIDGFGDIAVTVIILAKQLGLPLQDELYLDNLDKNKSFSWFMSAISEETVAYGSLDYINDVSMYYGHSLEDCLTAAWKEIKNREGVTIDGVFVRNKKKK